MILWISGVGVCMFGVVLVMFVCVLVIFLWFV